MEDAAKALILVADDNVENRAVAKATLEDEGYEVVLANDGEQAIAGFLQRSPDCVLLDIKMPKVDGIAACREIRALPGGADVPVVFSNRSRASTWSWIRGPISRFSPSANRTCAPR